MKFTPEVVAALKVLRDNAESDFERHRIDVLERDFTSPPTVEVVDENRQRFGGKIYYRHKTNRFRTNETIHREVWTYYHGTIPVDHDIHHVDGDTANNTLDNLQCIDKTTHGQIHREKIPSRKVVCVVCGKEFSTRKIGEVKYCSKKCQRAGRRLSGVDDVTKICPVCGQPFTCNRYDEIHTCSRACAEIFKRSRKEKITVTCAYCGKEFDTPKNNPAKCCSRLCRCQYYRQTHREERTCIVCGKKFQCAKTSQSKTCSHECRAQIIWQTRRANAENVTD